MCADAAFSERYLGLPDKEDHAYVVKILFTIK